MYSPQRSFTTTSLRRTDAAAASASSATPSPTSGSDSSASSSAAQLKPTPDHQPTTLRGIIDKYGGLYPLLGLGAAAAITKEFIILNEELLMVSNFAVVVLAGYVVLSDTVLNAQKDTVETDRKNVEEWGGLESDGYRAVIEAHKRNLYQADALRYVKNQFNQFVYEASKAKQVLSLIALRDSTEKKLIEIAAREQTENTSKAKQITQQATSTVRDYFKNADSKTKQQLIDNAIALLSGQTKQIQADRDPVKQAFLRFFKENTV